MKSRTGKPKGDIYIFTLYTYILIKLVIILCMHYITIIIYFITILTDYVSVTIYYIDIVIDYNKLYIYIEYLIILIIYFITKTEYLYPLRHSTETALSTSLSSVHRYFMYLIGLTKRSHVAPKMQHLTKMQHPLVSYESHRLSVRDNMDIPMREKQICDRMG